MRETSSAGRAMLGVLASLVAALIVAGVLAGCSATSRDDARSPGADAPGTDAIVVTTEDDGSEDDADSTDGSISASAYDDPGDAYTLRQVVALARHNVRAAFVADGSVAARATPHTWVSWTVPSGHLTPRGGALETMLGQYVGRWLTDEGLIASDGRPAEGEVRVYANSMERTHATAQHFVSGMLPVGDVTVETHYGLGETDPTFMPVLTFMSEDYRSAALAQIAEMGGDSGMAGVASDLADNFAVLADVCDYRHSEGYVSGDLADLDTADTNVVLEQGHTPSLTGSLGTATLLADALVMQRYESGGTQAVFGRTLTGAQWAQIAAIKDAYDDVLYTAPLVATNVAHPLLAEIGGELDDDDRRFTFLCGHDTGIVSVLAALGVSDYRLDDAIEGRAPVGSMVLFETWERDDGELFGRLRLLYQTTDQVCGLILLAGDERPAAVDLTLAGLKRNADGLYAYGDLRDRLRDATNAYDGLVTSYGDSR